VQINDDHRYEINRVWCLLSAAVQARRFSQFSQIVQMPDEADAKKILTASQETIGTPSYYVDERCQAGPEIQWPLLGWGNDEAQNRPL